MATETAWTAADLAANPHAAADKRAKVQKMFAAIAPSYDLNNRLHSLYIDQYWRRKTVKLAGVQPTDQIVDVACGTGDVTLKFAAALWSAPMRNSRPLSAQVVGIDFTFEMLPLAYGKARSAFAPVFCHPQPKFLSETIGWLNGDAQFLPLPDAAADILSIAFGIRNVQDPLAAFTEFRRVLRLGGRCMVLEFSNPTNPVIRWLYNLYCSKIMPITATWISRDRSGAYKYLPHSVATFLSREATISLLKRAGFTTVEAFPLTFGAVVVYRAC